MFRLASHFADRIKPNLGLVYHISFLNQVPIVVNSDFFARSLLTTVFYSNLCVANIFHATCVIMAKGFCLQKSKCTITICKVMIRQYCHSSHYTSNSKIIHVIHNRFALCKSTYNISGLLVLNFLFQYLIHDFHLRK